MKKNKHPKIKKLEYQYITDGIYIGSNQCCQSHFDERLIEKGITADVSLEEERIDAPFGIEFYFWLPIKKGGAPTFEQFKFGINALEMLVAMNKKIYIHCQNGHGRTAILACGYLIKNGKSLEGALQFIKQKRPSVHLNAFQMKSLEKFSLKMTQ